MNICFISRRYFPAISGMSVYAQNLLRELVALGHEVTMVSQYRNDAVGRGVYGGGPPPPVPGVRVVGLEAHGEQNGGRFEDDVQAIVDTVQHLHQQRPFDIIHAQYGYPPGLAALQLSRLLGVPNVVSIQGGDGHWVGVNCCGTHQRAIRAVLNHAGAVLIGCPSFAQEVMENHGTAPERFTYVPGAVDVSRFRPRADWQPGQWANAAHPTLLYHGRVDRRKGVLDLLYAFEQLAPTRPNLRLIVSGIGPDLEAVRQRVQTAPWQAQVELAGYVAYDEVPAVYHRADVFVSPTYAEGFSNTILEAMASGLPCVAAEAVGVVDCLRHAENGLLVRPGDVAALTNALALTLDDEPLRAQLAHAALNEVRSTYAWPIIGRQIDAVYRQLAGTTPDLGWPDDSAAPEPCRYREAPHLL
ncbi:glycosyltransferase family 4 protein [Solirubrum puertoriconensis]|uniref:Glycosyl transferase family 1 n=1 Tax=Solirubrum puertoriconensis TaxID=1751427 RepID=A0A9X0HIX3_SOLP1|nr:glycosyltransferase family 4 protein [Solirubrum puertoriconensis]KUG06735.1 glycosyl transferase family 1 [Solirubrum puertoriconensis]